MQILWLSHLVPYPPKGGVQQRSFHLLKQVSSYHDVSLLAFYQRAHQPSAEALKTAVDALSEFCDVLGVHAIPSDHNALGRSFPAVLSIFTNTPFTVRWLQSTDFRGSLQSLKARTTPDLIHYDTISLAQYRSLFPGIISCLTHHNVESDMLHRRAQNERTRAKRWYFAHEAASLRRYEEQIGASFDLHVACSDADAVRLRTIIPRASVFVAPNGADLDYFQPAAPGTKQIPQSLVFAGGLAWYPNASAMQFFFDRVWTPLVTRQPGTTMSVIGRHPPSWLQDLASQDNRIRVTGFVDDVRPYLHEAQVYVCPIFDGGGTKLKMIDALATGKAIVAHPIACEGLAIEHGVHALIASTPEEFVDAIDKLFRDAELRQALGAHARQLAETHYSFKTIGRALADTYSSLVPNCS